MLKAIFSVSVLLVLILSCKTTAKKSDVKVSTTTSYEGELGMKPGVGFESVFEDVRGSCVDFEIAEAEAIPGGQQVIYKMSIIESHQDLAATLNISSASQIKAAVPDTPASVSAKTQFALGSQFNINRYSVFLLLNVQVKNETTHLKNVTFKDSFKSLLDTGSGPNVDALRVECGDSYMAGYTTGGEFYGVVEIQTENEEAQAKVKQELGIGGSVPGVGEATIDNTVEASLKRVASKRNVKLWSFQRGGAGEEAAPVGTVDEMLARAKSLVSSAMLNKNPRKISATFIDYFTLRLDIPKEYRDNLIDARNSMIKLARMQSQMMDLQADIDFIFENPNMFVGITAEVLSRLKNSKTEVSNAMKSIYDLSLTCYKDYQQCKKIEDKAKVPQVNLPARRATLAQVNSAILNITTTLNSADKSAMSDGWFNTPECYVMVSAVSSREKGKSIPLRRTSTSYGCEKLNFSVDIPLALIKSTATTLGVLVKDLQLDVGVFEDDPTYDDLVGSTSILYSKIEAAGAVTQGIQSKAIIMDVGFQMK